MPKNPARRAALADAAIMVLAREGARGLTYRAVDAEATVPAGTTSNYFRTRDQLFDELGRRIHERLAPDADALREAAAVPPSRARQVELMQQLLTRIRDQAPLYLALVELRLEATRRPALREALTETLRDNLETDLAFHRAAGLPGDREEVVLLHLAMDGLLLNQLTVPDALGIVVVEATIESIVNRLTAAAI